MSSNRKPMFFCDKCTANYTCKTSLNRHINITHNSLVHTCICKKSYKRNEDLQKHRLNCQVLHGDSKSYTFTATLSDSQLDYICKQFQKLKVKFDLGEIINSTPVEEAASAQQPTYTDYQIEDILSEAANLSDIPATSDIIDFETPYVVQPSAQHGPRTTD